MQLEIELFVSEPNFVPQLMYPYGYPASSRVSPELLITLNDLTNLDAECGGVLPVSWDGRGVDNQPLHDPVCAWINN